MRLSDYQWYRKWLGGTWYHNRYIFDLGRSMITIWERNNLGENGGNQTTLTEETYIKNK